MQKYRDIEIITRAVQFKMLDYKTAEGYEVESKTRCHLLLCGGNACTCLWTGDFIVQQT